LATIGRPGEPARAGEAIRHYVKDVGNSNMQARRGEVTK
jgi:hypothetical protein